ncbi:Rv1355c family protein [Gordonia sp. OPL2]|uniref:Rv1355c family protein n=1 Tax=Gordonia sp. OPL2 TaxID=2486274 RepID=UPI0016556987|nr:Rv1355c family protein [Gordonia sp. OPL2]ROZ83723.1 Rv1355c family protein [Gordonia sp. OPL2]
MFPESSAPGYLIDDPAVSVIDATAAALRSLPTLLPPPGPDLMDEPAGYAWYPWRRTLVKVPGPRSYRRLRLDRNRHKLTAAEQDRASALRIGIVGLSVGHAIALTLALEGLAGELHLADFDSLELTNMNRIPATLMDLELNKAVVASRRIAEIDPYVRTRIFDDGITPDNIDAFLDGLDLVVEECDSFDVKVLVRQKCREAGIPVIMETSDGGVLDVERFDLEPDRPILHGLAGDLRIEDLVGLDRAALTPLAVKVLEPAKVSARMAASAIELGFSVTAWPQLAGDVLLGGASVAAAVRRIAQGRPLPSGRVRFDRDLWLDDLADPLLEERVPEPATAQSPAGPEPETLSDVALVRYAAQQAPSAGNQQPWSITAEGDAVTVALDPERTSTLDLAHRASLVAVGAAVHNARVAAASRGKLGPTEILGAGEQLSARVTLTDNGVLTDDSDPADATELPSILSRSTRREAGDASPISEEDAVRLDEAGATARTRLIQITDREEIGRCASILAHSDRIRFLTPELHQEMFAELTDDPCTPVGIQVDSLDLPPAMAGMFDVLRRPDVMALLDEWDAGAALGADTGRRVATASAVLLLVQKGSDSEDYLRAGQTMQQLWITAEMLGYRVHPMTPTFFYALDDAEARGLSSAHGDDLVALRRELLETWPVAEDEAMTIALRISRAVPPPPVD